MVITKEKHVFLGDTVRTTYKHIFVTAKLRGVDAERKKEKRIPTLNSSSYATMHRKILEDRPKSAKISHFGQNYEYITKSFVRTIPEKALRV